MKPFATLLHAARVGVKQGSALADALKRGSLAAASFDIGENEPVLSP